MIYRFGSNEILSQKQFKKHLYLQFYFYFESLLQSQIIIKYKTDIPSNYYPL